MMALRSSDAGASPTGISHRRQMDWRREEERVFRLQVRIAEVVSQTDRLLGRNCGFCKGLSRVHGNGHARFLGGWRLETVAAYPIRILRSPRIELLAWIIISKYADALPLYRQEKILKRCSADITRTAMAQWVIRLAELLQPLLEILHAQQMQANYLQGDETRIQVHKEPGKNPTGDKQMWVLRSLGTGRGPPSAAKPQKPIIQFHYDPARSGAVVERLIGDFDGSYFQCDGYSAYSKPCAKKKLTQLGCWDHARRKFKDAEKALPKKNKTGAPAKCAVGLSLINKLYAIERKIEKLPLDEKHEQRQKLSVPALAKLHDWLQHNVERMPKSGKTGEAIHYTLNQWNKLKNYTKSPELKISNVLAENAIRPFVIGRNYDNLSIMRTFC